VTLGPDQQRALRVLRYWFGHVEIVQVWRGPGTPPRLDQPTLFDQDQGPGSAGQATVKAPKDP
jgi:hypothetical protein